MAGREGVVFIAEDFDDDDFHIWPGRFSAHWESREGDDSLDGPEGVSADEAIEWGRAHADVVYIRAGEDDFYHSAGAVLPDDDPPPPVWKPGTVVPRRRWRGYEHLDIASKEPIEWEARLPVGRVVVRARSHEEALSLAYREWDRRRPAPKPPPWWRRWWLGLRRRGIYVEDTGFDPYDDLRPRATGPAPPRR